MSVQAIADAVSQASTTISKRIVGSANLLTAALCQATGQQPSSVCAAPPIPALRSQIGG